jgi:dTDP-4-amino-4,6-dideoxygalactose transaminase
MPEARQSACQTKTEAEILSLSNLPVPFANLYQQYNNLKPEMDAAIASVIAESSFIRGPHVELFEKAFAKAIGTQHCVSAANGTDTLYIAMRSLGVKPGDEVIVPAMSWISTSETVTQAGAKVVFCDIDPFTHTMDAKSLEHKVNSRTVGIIPVHLYGQPADMDGILACAERHNLWVIEDCAQAHLATYKGRTVGTMGIAGSFSFYPGKNLGAMGDAGAIVTGDADLARRMAMLARHGGIVKGVHEIEGINSRLDGLQAAILNVKLPHLTAWTRRRRQLAIAYIDALIGLSDLKLPREAANTEHVYHLFTICHTYRDELARHLKSKDIQTVINYPKSLPFLPCYEHQGAKPEDYPVAFKLQNELLCLPIFAEMTDAQIRQVSASVMQFCKGSSLHNE